MMSYDLMYIALLRILTSGRGDIITLRSLMNGIKVSIIIDDTLSVYTYILDI